MFPAKKMDLRKKAMDAMMREKPSMEIPSKKRQAMEMVDETEGMGPSQDQEGAEQEGFEAFLVSPEEKAMILDMRKRSGGDSEEGSLEDEGFEG